MRPAPWWSKPPVRRWPSWERAGAVSYFWHEVCRGILSEQRLDQVVPDVSPSREAESGTDELVDPRYLVKYLIEADVRLVRAQYLWKLHEEGKSLLRRQEVDGVRFQSPTGSWSDCLVTPEELIQWADGGSPARIFAISHCWESREHPDPCGYQLRLIHDYTRRLDHAFDCEMWLFYDYVSLCQYKRNHQQEQSFRRAMQQMHVLYAHNSTTTLRIESLTPDAELQRCRGRQIWIYDAGSDRLRLVSLENLRYEDPGAPSQGHLHGNGIPYRQRGWCEAEAQWSAMRGRSDSSIQIDGNEAVRTYEVRAPMPPELFRQRVCGNEGLKFTWRSDLAQVVALQEEVFREKARSCEELLQKGLPDEEFITLAVALRSFARLEVLHLRKCQIRERGADALAKGLQTLTAKKLKIICSDIDGLCFLVKALSLGLGSVRSLDLSGHSFSHGRGEKLGDAEVQELAEALKRNCGELSELNLASNDIGPEGAKALASALQQPTCRLAKLRLEGNRIGAEGAQALLEALQMNRSLVQLSCADNDLDAEHLQALREALQSGDATGPSESCVAGHHPKVTGDPQATRPGDVAPEAALKALAPVEKTVSLQVRPKIQAMSESLRMNGTSTHLQLKWAMGDLAAKALAASLAVNTTVTHIDWAGNKIGDGGAQALASALLLNRTVTSVDLSENLIGDVGAKALAWALRENGTLQEINLQKNLLGFEGRQALLEEPSECRVLL